MELEHSGSIDIVDRLVAGKQRVEQRKAGGE
jgi:hypothetical protein